MFRVIIQRYDRSKTTLTDGRTIKPNVVNGAPNVAEHFGAPIFRPTRVAEQKLQSLASRHPGFENFQRLLTVRKRDPLEAGKDSETLSLLSGSGLADGGVSPTTLVSRNNHSDRVSDIQQGQHVLAGEAASASTGSNSITSPASRSQQKEPEHRDVARLRWALATSEKSRGPEHLDVATNCKNLAFLLCLHNKFDEAEPLLRRALAISETAQGPEHPDILSLCGHLSSVFQQHNKHHNLPDEGIPCDLSWSRADSDDDEVLHLQAFDF